MLRCGTRLPEARGLGGEGGKYRRGAYLPQSSLERQMVQWYKLYRSVIYS